MTRRLEYGPPPGGLTPNETRCLDTLRAAGADMALSTMQVATQAGLNTSSATVALTRLLDRGEVRRIERPVPTEPVRWVAGSTRRSSTAA